MSEIRIASRYAKSLIGLATDQGELDRIYEDVQTIFDTASANRDLMAMLKSPVIKKETKIEILRNIFKSSQPITLTFLAKVVDARRENYLVDICNQFIGMYNHIKGIALATVTTAVPFDEAGLAKIKAYIAQKINKPDVKLTVKTDPGIIGGLIISYEDKLLDMSIKSELHKLKQSLN